MMGRRRSSSLKPIAFSMARAGARLGPSVIAALLFFELCMRKISLKDRPKLKGHHLCSMMALKIAADQGLIRWS
jgi:hypothetical protein